jgi:hypothetical protein
MMPLLILGHVTLLRMLGRGQEEEGDNWSKVLLKYSLWISLGSITLKYIGHAIYAYLNGRFYDIFDILYLLLHSVSDYILIFLLIFLSFGWTVTFRKHPYLDIYIPLACLFGFVHVILVVMNKINDGDHDKYHMFDSIPAYIMLTFRLVAFGMFIYGIIRSIVKLKQE